MGKQCVHKDDMKRYISCKSSTTSIRELLTLKVFILSYHRNTGTGNFTILVIYTYNINLLQLFSKVVY